MYYCIINGAEWTVAMPNGFQVTLRKSFPVSFSLRGRKVKKRKKEKRLSHKLKGKRNFFAFVMR